MDWPTRYRSAQRFTVGQETWKRAATSQIGQPSSTTRRPTMRRWRGVRAALGWVMVSSIACGGRRHWVRRPAVMGGYFVVAVATMCPRARVWVEIVKPTRAGDADGAMAKRGTSMAVTVRWKWWVAAPLGGAAPRYLGRLASSGAWIAPAGRVTEPGVPAPAASWWMVAGMSYTVQCQNPDPVGASTSYMVTT